MSELQTCENCGRLIGRLERAHAWDGHVVCAACKVTLESQPVITDAGSTAAQPMIPPPLPPRQPLATDAPFATPVVEPALPGPEVDACAACGAVVPREQLTCDGKDGVPLCPGCAAAGQDGDDDAAAAPAAVVETDGDAIAHASDQVQTWRRAAGPTSGWAPWAAFAVAVTLLAFAAGVSIYHFRPALPAAQAPATGPAGENGPTREAAGTESAVPPTAIATAVTGTRAAAPKPAIGTPKDTAPPGRADASPPRPSPSNGSIFSEIHEPAGGNAPGDHPPPPPADAGGTRRVRPASPAPAQASRAPAAPTPAAPPPVLATPSTQPQTLHGVAVHLDRGKTALNAGDYRGASAAFKNALDTQRASPQALHGMALAAFFLSDEAGAVALMEKAFAARADRAIAHNLAVLHLRVKNPMRAAKFIRDYLSRPGVPLDEPLQNVLGAALASAGDGARAGALFNEVRTFYFHYDDRLAAARADGRKRWGMTWIPAGQADYKWQQSKSRSEEVARRELEAGRAAVRTKRARDAMHDFRTSFGLHSDDEERAVEERLSVAFKNERTARDDLDGARRLLEQAEMPPFPKDFEFIPIDALTPDQHPPQR